MRDRRIHNRFDVSNLGLITGRTKGDLIKERVVSMSIGGCGFCCSAENFQLKVGDRVTCVLQWNEGDEPAQPVHIEAHVLYIIPHPIEDEVGRFFGVGFVANQEDKIQPFVDGLEELLKKGQIKMAQ